ncbi:MAG: UDP-N-acetylglucosamine 1-carboxyvinyltransferase [Candidatus Gracilibacteria bacterium]|nr:UDP-N-acetylglucosamine 1-carboxyvinyltransferase [Candidatus Gracilibacteria bacterium]
MLKVTGGQRLSGTVEISGSKNASLPIIAASLLLEKVTLHNVPRIGDIFSLLEIIKSLGVVVDFTGNTLVMDMSRISLENMNRELMKKIRASILLLAPLLYRFGAVDIPFPGGCNIGKRPIDEHLNGLREIGYESKDGTESIHLSGTLQSGDRDLYAGFAVTATENLITANVCRPGHTRIHLAAIEPHVANLVDFLKGQGADITINYDHTIDIVGIEKIRPIGEFSIVHDYIEAGTFVVLGALASEEYIDIHHACIRGLTSFLVKCREVGVRFEERGGDILRVYRSEHLKAVKFQTNVFPGFPTDLQSVFCILLSQAEGVSRVQEIMFEGRLNFLVELEKMKGHPALMNPHEALIFGPTHLRGSTVSSWDLRAGVAMIIAGLVATGDTYITNVEYIERGYEDIIGKIGKLGVQIERTE